MEITDYEIKENEERSGFHCCFSVGENRILCGYNGFPVWSAGMYDFQSGKKRSDKLEWCLSKQRR